MTKAAATLPDTWRIVPVGNVCSLQGGFAFKSDEFRPSGIPIVRISNVKERGLDWRSEVFWSEELGPRIAKFLLQEKDVLISMTGNVGETCMVRSSDLPALLNQRVGRFKIPDPTVLDDEYLLFVSKTTSFRQAVSGGAYGAVQQNVSGKGIESAEIPLPPLPEQKKIAHILSTVQRAIEAQERIIQTTTELKKALMHKLFTEGLRNEPQKQTEIGPVPESWEVVPFDKFVTLQRGYDLRKQDFRKGEVPVIGATQVIGYHDTANVKAPGVTVVRSGSSAGKPLFIAEDFWAHNVLLYVKDFQGNVPKFVYYKILALDLTQYRQGVAVPTLNRNTFSAIELALPSPEEQQEIADVLDAVGNKTEIAERKRDQLQDLFRTLLHELMTAKTRVHELEREKEEVA
ncbi:MAG: restriction endonuclease subunit S [Propionivibrio sp.]|nr:restriction endonuclease subunit S [Propionivibrio sp.]